MPPCTEHYGCVRCKGRLHRGQWIAPPLLSKEQRKKLLYRSMVIWMPIMFVAQITATVSLVFIPMYTGVFLMFVLQFVTLGVCALAPVIAVDHHMKGRMSPDSAAAVVVELKGV